MLISTPKRKSRAEVPEWSLFGSEIASPAEPERYHCEVLDLSNFIVWTSERAEWIESLKEKAIRFCEDYNAQNLHLEEPHTRNQLFVLATTRKTLKRGFRFTQVDSQLVVNLSSFAYNHGWQADVKNERGEKTPLGLDNLLVQVKYKSTRLTNDGTFGLDGWGYQVPFSTFYALWLHPVFSDAVVFAKSVYERLTDELQRHKERQGRQITTDCFPETAEEVLGKKPLARPRNTEDVDYLERDWEDSSSVATEFGEVGGIAAGYAKLAGADSPKTPLSAPVSDPEKENVDPKFILKTPTRAEGETFEPAGLQPPRKKPRRVHFETEGSSSQQPPRSASDDGDYNAA